MERTPQLVWPTQDETFVRLDVPPKYLPGITFSYGVDGRRLLEAGDLGDVYLACDWCGHPATPQGCWPDVKLCPDCDCKYRADPESRSLRVLEGE